MRTFALTVALLALVGTTYANDDDPEPPPSGGKSLHALQGKWAAVQRISGGETVPYATTSYEFDGAKVSYTLKSKKGGNVLPRQMTAKIDPKRPGVLELTLDTTNTTNKYFFKIEKEKLYLSLDRSNDPKAKPDFTGNNAPVLVYQKSK